MESQWKRLLGILKKIYNKVNGESMTLTKSIFFLFFILPIFAQESEINISISGELIRMVPPSSQHSACFLKLSNSSSKEIKLTRVESSISKSVEIHDVVMDSGKMMMRPITEITIPANGSVELKPGSLHIMFLGLVSPLKLGDTHKVILFFDSKKSITIQVPVKEITGMMKKMAE
jgi:copper(I)-binding protein